MSSPNEFETVVDRILLSEAVHPPAPVQIKEELQPSQYDRSLVTRTWRVADESVKRWSASEYVEIERDPVRSPLIEYFRLGGVVRAHLYEGHDAAGRPVVGSSRRGYDFSSQVATRPKTSGIYYSKLAHQSCHRTPMR
jgi:hypothetical protein